MVNLGLHKKEARKIETACRGIANGDETDLSASTALGDTLAAASDRRIAQSSHQGFHASVIGYLKADPLSIERLLRKNY